MRRTCCLLVVLFGSWLNGLGQNVAKFTSPRIWATFHRLGQTAEIPQTRIYTPKNWGTFSISIAMVLTVAGGNNSTWDGPIQFADGPGENGPYEPFEVILNTTFARTRALPNFPSARKQAHR
jgi:hypothetical protein